MTSSSVEKICKNSLDSGISRGREMDKKETNEKWKMERSVNMLTQMRESVGESEKLTEKCGQVSLDGNLPARSASCN